MWFADNVPLVVVGIAWCERHEDRVTTGTAHIVDISAHVSAVSIDGVHLAGLLDGDNQRVVADARDGCPCAPAVVWAIVVVADGDDDPVAWADGIADGRPQAFVECAAAHTSEGLIFHGDAVAVEEWLEEGSPSPLAVVAVAQCAVAHGRVAHEEEHGVVATASTARFGACRLCKGEAVAGAVIHAIDIGWWLWHVNLGVEKLEWKDRQGDGEESFWDCHSDGVFGVIGVI